MDALVEALIRSGIPAVADIVYGLSRTGLAIADHTHQEVIRTFMTGDHPATVIYGSTSLTPAEALAAAANFFKASEAVPYASTTSDGWLTILAPRKALTLREQFTTLWVGLDKQPHEFLLLVRAHANGTHTYACCRYTDYTKFNLGGWFSRGGAERAYRLSIAMRTIAPLLTVTATSLNTFP